MMALSGSEGDALIEQATAYAVQGTDAADPAASASGSVSESGFGHLKDDPAAPV